MSKTIEPFFMVHVVGENSPTYRHTTFDLAKQEAIRLMKVSGKAVTVLSAIQTIAPPQQWEELSHQVPDDLPF